MKKNTVLLTGNDPLEKILSASGKVTGAVGATLGPLGRNAIIRKYQHKPFVTHDGVTVARALELNDPVEDTVADLLREGATNMENITGDATTTVTILTNAILVEGARLVKEGMNPMEAKRVIDSYGEEAVAELEAMTKKRVTKKDLINVATVSSGSKEIGKKVGDAIYNAGKDTPVMLNFSESNQTIIELIDGVSIPAGSASPYLIDDNGSKEEVMNPFIVVVDAKLRDKEDIMPILRVVAQLPPENKKVTIIASDISGDALSLLIVNKINKFAGITAVRVPESVKAPSQYLADIAKTVGAKVLSVNGEYPLADTKPDSFGLANKVVVSNLETLIIGGHAIEEDLNAHREELTKQAKSGKTLVEREFAKQRLATLSQQVLSIHVGGQSQSEAEEKHYRYEDAVGATRAAARGGILPGGGSALYQVGRRLKFVALSEPVFFLLSNAGILRQGDEVHSLYTEGKIYDVLNPGTPVDPYEAGIVDPAESEIEAVKTATAIAGLLLTSAVMIVEEVVSEEDKA